MDEPNHALIGQQRLVEESLRAGDRFVHGAADHVQVGGRRVARLQFDVDVDARGCRRRAAVHDAQIAEARPHPFAADVEIRRSIVNARDNRLETEAAHDHAIARGRQAAGRDRRVAFRPGLGLQEFPGNRLHGGPRVAPGRAGVAGRDGGCLTPGRLGNRRRLRLQLLDHIVNFASRLTELCLQFLVQAPTERLFALAQGVVALAHADFGRFEQLTLLDRQPLLVFERAHVAIDLRQVLGELRLARADVLAGCGHDRGVQAKSGRDFERQAAARTAVQQSIRGSEGLGVEAERGAGDALGG